jgi:hypothetical protein
MIGIVQPPPAATPDNAGGSVRVFEKLYGRFP